MCMFVISNDDDWEYDNINTEYYINHYSNELCIYYKQTTTKHKLFTSCFLISIQYYNCKMQRPFDRYTPILSIFHLSIQNRYRTQYFTPFFNSIFRYHNNTPRTFTIHSKTITIWLFKPILY